MTVSVQNTNLKSVYGKVKYYELIKHANTYSVMWKQTSFNFCVYTTWLDCFKYLQCATVCTFGCHFFTEALMNFAQDCIVLSRLNFLSRLCHYCPATNPPFWCRPIRFDFIPNATDIQGFCETWRHVFSCDRRTGTDTTWVALQQSPKKCCSTSRMKYSVSVATKQSKCFYKRHYGNPF